MSTDPHDVRYPRQIALRVAAVITSLLGRSTKKIVTAGSLRRGKESVHDIEVVYIPLIEQRADPSDLFGATVPFNLADSAIDAMESGGILARRKNTRGHETFGDKNKLMVHVPSGVPVDLFATTEDCWWNYLVCRTGGAETNKAIATAALKLGWTWNPYGVGFSRGPEVVAMHSEEEVFRFVGIPYLPPEKRV